MIATFSIDWAALACHPAYAEADRNALRQNGAIEYDAGRLAAIAEPVLFYGPYIALDAGVYLLTFRGQIEGTLAVDFAGNRGHSFKAIALDRFTAPVCLVVTRPLADFEVRGAKTPSLKSFRLEGIDVDRVYVEPAR